MNNNRSFSAAIGEYLVLGELLKRNIEAYLAHRETQKGWGVVIVTSESTKRVQVKTMDWLNQLAVNVDFAGGFDYLVVVLLIGKIRAVGSSCLSMRNLMLFSLRRIN
jgi:hypothetical protein